MWKKNWRSTIIIASILLLLGPALLINLGLMTFIDDEAIRSLVALEMKLSGNYLVPTLNGDLYLNKPPLFNWILLVYFNLLGGFSEFNARLATVVSLLGYTATIFWFFRKHYGFRKAFINAFALVTCGRILLWDSHLALIDITFSWVIFTGFMVIYHQFERGRWYRLFIWSYALAAVAFLLKGLPAVVFQGVTLLTWFGYRREWKRLLSIPHVVGLLVFVLLTGSYYYAYHQQQPLDDLFLKLFTESSKRTAIQYGLGSAVLHFFTFPLEMIYHFLPWSLMCVYLFDARVWEVIRRDRFITYNALVFLTNILLYWTSVEVYPRYLLMHAPLIFSVYLHLHFHHQALETWQFKTVKTLLFALLIPFALASFLPLLWDRLQVEPMHWLKGSVLAILMTASVWMYLYWKKTRLLTLVLAMLVIRLGFDWFVLPDRFRNDWGSLCKESTLSIGRQLKYIPSLYIYKYTEFQPTNAYYLTWERQKIVRRKHSDFRPGEYLIVSQKLYPDVRLDAIGPLYVRLENRTLRVGRLLRRPRE